MDLSPPAHHATLLTQPFSHDKFPPAPVFHPYEDKKKPFESVDTAQFPNMPMPKPVKTYPQKPEVIHVEKERPAQQQEASILSPVSAGPRNPQFVAPYYVNSDIATLQTSTLPTIIHEDPISDFAAKQFVVCTVATDCTNISTVPNRIFVDSKDDIPRLFLIAPTFEEPLIKGPYKPVRILLPCQAPSAYYGGEDAVHMTSHNGYTIKNPNDFLHNNKDAVKMMGTIASYFAVAANVVASIQGVPGYGGDVAAAAAASLAQTADNRAHLNTTGLDTNSIYEKHMATENHQREALKILLRAASAADPTQSMTGELNGVVLNNGKTIWVCKECYDLMLKGESVKRDYHVSLRDYDSLTRRDPSINVLLRCSASLIIFTNALRSHPYPQRVSIRIAPEYFEAPERSHRAALASIQSLFNDLGTVLYRQRITSLEIQGKSETGYVYASLQNVLRCPSLEQLAILGMPLFLQGSDMPKECRLLRKLVLDGVRVDTEQAANNLCALIFANQSLTNLRLTRASFTKVALDTLHFDINKQNVRLFKNFTHLNLSENNLDVVSATTFVTMAFKSFDLTHLDISGNPRIGDSGCRAILTLLRQRNKKLVELNTERTGIEWRTKDEIKQLLNIPQ
ncbi:hypothetical protein BGX27_010680 [Mortierella sp. AM989]|nr:hypothetical protein BGX27_010680 [Mortierella sp. AM989]